jgi:hypothetical protein
VSFVVKGWPFCAFCQKPADKITQAPIGVDQKEYKFEVYCHGKTEVQILNISGLTNNLIWGKYLEWGIVFEKREK